MFPTPPLCVSAAPLDLPTRTRTVFYFPLCIFFSLWTPECWEWLWRLSLIPPIWRRSRLHTAVIRIRWAPTSLCSNTKSHWPPPNTLMHSPLHIFFYSLRWPCNYSSSASGPWWVLSFSHFICPPPTPLSPAVSKSTLLMWKESHEPSEGTSVCNYRYSTLAVMIYIGICRFHIFIFI